MGTGVVAVGAGLVAVPVGVLCARLVPGLARGGEGVEDHDVRGVAVPAWTVVMAMVVIWAAMALRFGWSLLLAPYLFLGAALVLVSAVDLEDHRIPDRVVFPVLGVSVVAVVAISVLRDVPAAALWAAIGAVAYSLVLFVLFLVNPAGIGFGDVKLGLLLGLYLGWLDISLVLVGLAAGALLGALVGLGVLAVRGWSAGRRTGFPFGPPLAAGALLVVLFSESLVGVG